MHTHTQTQTHIHTHIHSLPPTTIHAEEPPTLERERQRLRQVVSFVDRSVLTRQKQIVPRLWKTPHYDPRVSTKCVIFFFGKVAFVRRQQQARTPIAFIFPVVKKDFGACGAKEASEAYDLRTKRLGIRLFDINVSIVLSRGRPCSRRRAHGLHR
jgi:hypothetical protein